jgi:hypothetical protein
VQQLGNAFSDFVEPLAKRGHVGMTLDVSRSTKEQSFPSA